MKKAKISKDDYIDALHLHFSYVGNRYMYQCTYFFIPHLHFQTNIYRYIIIILKSKNKIQLVAHFIHATLGMIYKWIKIQQQQLQEIIFKTEKNQFMFVVS